jgi:hypothetical protein
MCIYAVCVSFFELHALIALRPCVCVCVCVFVCVCVCVGWFTATMGQPDWGVGDAVTVVDGQLLSSNCNCSGFSRPAVLTIDGPKSRIDVLHRGDMPPAGLTLDSIGSGPNLVSTGPNGSYVDIPKDDDNIGNILEHAANTMVALKVRHVFGQDGVTAVFWGVACSHLCFVGCHFAVRCRTILRILSRLTDMMVATFFHPFVVPTRIPWPISHAIT